MLESKFQSEVIKDLRVLYPGCVILKNDANYLQGIPDVLILFEDRWAMLEFKRTKGERRQPNQRYYVDKLNAMSYAAFIYPSNRAEVYDALQLALRPRR